MPLQKLQFRPGINREGTTLANEGGWFECDKVRFRSGFPEKIGGWSALTYTQFLGVCRSLWCWITQKNFNLLGVGTNLKFYVENGGTYNDITPIRETNSNAVAPGSITVTANGTALTIVDSNAELLQIGNFVIISGVPTLSGVDVNGEYRITTVNNSTSFTVTLLTATTGSSSASSITVAYQISTGSAIYTIGTGWGTGPWPPYLTATLTNPFATVSGNTTITVTQASHGLVNPSSPSDPKPVVFFSSISSSTVGGVPSAVFKKAFPVTVTGTNTYTISTVGLGSWAIPSVTNATQGGTVVVNYPSSTLGDASTNRGWGQAYTVGIGQQLRLWSQANFGEYLLFSPRGGAIYIWEPGVGSTPSFGDAYRGVQLKSGAATPVGWVTPVATQATCPNEVNQILVSDTSRIVIAFGANDPSGTIHSTTQDPLLIRWSDQESYAIWTPTPDNQAGDYRLSRGSYIVGALQTRQEIVVWTDAAVYSMQYIGPPYVFGFTLLADNISIMSQNAAATAAGVTYWMGTDKFYSYSGRVETLPCALRTYVYSDINLTQQAQIFASTNEAYSEVWWFYCSADSDIIDRYVVFNYLDRVWYYGSMDRTAWLDSALRPYPVAANGVQVSFLASSINATQTTVTLNNSATYPSSGVVTVGTEQIVYTANSGNVLSGCIRGANGTTAASHAAGTPATVVGKNILVYHESAVDDGTTNPPSPIYAYVQSSDFDMGDGHNYGFAWRMIPDITFDGSTTTLPDMPQVNIEMIPRQNPGAPYGTGNNPLVRSMQNYTTRHYYTVQEFTEIVYTRVRGRQMAFKISSDALGTQWQLGVPRLDVRPDGRR